MSEHPTRPTEIDEITWGEAVTTYTHTRPDGSKMEVGWQPKGEYPAGTASPATKGEVIPADEFNWLERAKTRSITYLAESEERIFECVSEGLGAEIPPPYSFRVVPPGGVVKARLAAKFHVQRTAANGAVANLCVDGGQLYYISGAGVDRLIIASPVDGSEIDEITIPHAVTAMTCDRAAVLLSGTAAYPGLRKWTRAGVFVAAGGVEYGHLALASNGIYTIGGAQTVNPTYITFWTNEVPTETGNVAHTANVLCVAIDSTQGYTGEAAKVGAWTLSTRANAWTTTFATTVQTTPAAIATDGDYVYVATDLKTLVAGGDANLYCLSRYDGSIVWSLDVEGEDLVGVCVDDNYIWVTANTDAYLIDKRTTTIIAQPGNLDTVVTDGVCVYGRSATGADYLYGAYVGYPMRRFQSVYGNDPTRRPFYTLAIPV